MSAKTQLYDYHKKNAEIVDFAGFKMPIRYKGILEECFAVRNHAGIFDISHMGRAYIEGKDAEYFLDYLTPNNVSKLQKGAAHYSTLCNENGGIIDDIVLLRFDDELFFVIFNANNRERDLQWLSAHRKEFKVDINHVSDHVAMIAIQGPKAKDITQSVCKENVLDIGRFKIGELTISDTQCFASGTGYTGEEGFEIFIPNSSVEKPINALRVWRKLLTAGEKEGIRPCGLGARDILRLEAGMCLYGNDIDESITPYEANIGFIVKLDKEANFLGKDALSKQKKDGVARIRVGLKLLEPGIPRKGYNIIHQDRIIGKITSGTYSPILKYGIAMGYVPNSIRSEEPDVLIDIRGRQVRAQLSPMPFYNTEVYGWKRRKK